MIEQNWIWGGGGGGILIGRRFWTERINTMWEGDVGKDVVCHWRGNNY